MSEVKRWTAKRKQEVVVRLLQGESLDALALAHLTQDLDDYLARNFQGGGQRVVA